jgi:hypothetical protein
MDFKPVIDHLQNRLPKLLGVYAFGSRVVSGGQNARPDCPSRSTSSRST